MLTGNMNTRCTLGDCKSTPGGNRLKTWATNHGLQIETPDLVSFRTVRGTIELDIFVAKNTRLRAAITETSEDSRGSNQQPLFTLLGAKTNTRDRRGVGRYLGSSEGT